MDNNNYDNYTSPELDNNAPYGDDPNSGNSYDNNAYGTNSYGSDTYGDGSYDNNAYGSDAYGTNSYGNDTYGDGSYSNNAYGSNSYDNNAYGQYNGSYNGSYGYNNSYYNNNQGGKPVNKNGKPIPNNFGMKLTFSIIEIFTCTLFGILALVFTVLQNNAYKMGNWEDFKSKRKISNIMLWIGFAFSLLGVIIIILAIVFFVNVGDGYLDDFVNEIENGYEYDYDYDNDFDFDDDTAYPDSGSTLQLKAAGEDMTVGGVSVTIPTDVRTFLSATGITMEDDLEQTQLEGDYDELYYFSEEYNNYSMIDVYNTSDNDDYAINGYVGGIKLDYEEAGAPSFEWRGITEQSSEDDVYAALGNPDDKEDYDDSVEITYYGGSGWVSFSFTPDGKMIDFWLSNYEALD